MSTMSPKAALAAILILCVAIGCLAPAVALCAGSSGAPEPASPAMLTEASFGLCVGRVGPFLLQGKSGSSADAPLCRENIGRAIACRVAQPARATASPAADALEVAASATVRCLLRCVMDKDGKK